MTDELKELAARLVVGRKRDGRSVYDAQAKRQLVMACRESGLSVARIARECGVNANQLGRWLREQEQRLTLPDLVRKDVTASEAFVAVTVQPHAVVAEPAAPRLQARLPNGVVVDLHECDAQTLAAVVEALGRVACSASTSA